MFSRLSIFPVELINIITLGKLAYLLDLHSSLLVITGVLKSLTLGGCRLFVSSRSRGGIMIHSRALEAVCY